MKRLVTAAFSIALSTNLYAQIAVPFLQIPPDARHSGMGNIGVATSTDASANFNNPAKLAFSDRTFGGNITRFAWLKELVDDMHITNISGYYKPKTGNQAIGVYYRAFDHGIINFTTPTGQPNGTFSPLDQTIGVNYAKKIFNNISLGVGLKYINSEIISGNATGSYSMENGQAVAGDLGLFGMAGKKDNFKLNYGIALSNIGSKINYGRANYNLPTNIRFGIAPVFQKNKNKILFGLEINQQFYGTPLAYSIGTEYSFNNTIYARAGYWNGNDAFANYFTLGLGGRIMKQVGLDFAYRIGEGVVYNKTAQFSLVFDIKSFDKEVIKTL
jgi:Type IX secretion system protein PorV